MEKRSLLVGMLVGVGLSACTVTFASDSLQAYLFPSKVIFHVNGLANNADVSGDPVINYNNKAYIPLRLFAESIGAKVNYQDASDASGTHQIDIYTSDFSNLFSMQDHDGYVSIGQFQSKVNDSQNENSTYISGIIRFNKNMDGKAIEIDALDADKNRVGASGYLFIHGLGTWNVGDVRVFDASMFLKQPAASYQVLVKDGWALTTTSEFYDGALRDFAGLVFGKADLNAEKKALLPSLQFKNQSAQDITIQQLNVEYQVVKINGDQEQPLFDYKIPALEGNIPARSWYVASLPAWNLRDQNGDPITPGKYVLRIQVPPSLSYTVDGSSEMKTLTDFSKFKEWEYDFTQSDIDTVVK
jgi:hypothetical protein